jgi:hypothetical protein
MSKQPIYPFDLLSESLSQISPIYLPLMATTVLRSLLSIAISAQPLVVQLTIIFSCSPIITGIEINFIYRYLTQGTIDLRGAIAKTTVNKNIQLIIGFFLYCVVVQLGLICLIVPGIYVLVKYSFYCYAILFEDCSVNESSLYSSKLVKDRWWRVFGSMLVGMILLLPMGFIYYICFVAVENGMSPNIFYISHVIGIPSIPIFIMYYVKLYCRLRETADFQPKNIPRIIDIE